MTEREIGDLAVNEKVDYTTDKLSGAAAEKSASLSGGAASKRLVVIEYQQVVKGFGEKTVLPGFSLAINQGEFVTIVGASGCGKTTLLKLTNGLLLPDEGTVLVHGRDIRTEDLIKLRRNMGYAIQGSVLFPHMTVAENIAYVPNLLNGRDKERTKKAVAKWLGIVGLSETLLERYPDELSGGQQQRVGIARALAASPDILLMDEPFGAVDEITRGQLQDEIARIHRETGITILFVTHDIHEALKLATKVLVLDQGNLAQYASPAELLEAPATEQVRRLVGKR